MARISKKKASFGTSMGVSSIIAILVILVLVVFSTLSITTSKADLTLSQKSSDSIKAYYEADSVAEDMLCEVAIAVTVSNDWRAELTQNGYNISSATGGTLVSYSVPIDRNRKINIELLVDDNGGITRQLWQVVPAREWVPDNTLNLFQP